MKKFFSLLLIVGVLTLLVTGCTKTEGQKTPEASEKPKEVITLKATSFLASDHPMSAMIPTFINKVKEKTNGKVVVDFLGGPEVMEGMQQGEAVRKGIMIDMAFLPGAYYEALVPETLAMNLSKNAPWEERENGFYDAMVEYHKKSGLMYLGRWLYSPQYLWTKKPVKSLNDLKGMKMRTAANFDKFMNQMGIVPVTVAPGDVYTALERGMVDGFGFPVMGVRKNGWTEFVKNVIGHSFYDAQNCAIILNLSKWDSLSPEIQKAIEEAAGDFEREMLAYYKEEIDKEWKVLTEQNGVKVIEFSQDEANKYIQTIDAVQWATLQQKAPASVEKLKELSQKKN